MKGRRTPSRQRIIDEQKSEGIVIPGERRPTFNCGEVWVTG